MGKKLDKIRDIKFKINIILSEMLLVALLLILSMAIVNWSDNDKIITTERNPIYSK